MNIEEEIVRALIAVYDPSTSSEQRVQYNKVGYFQLNKGITFFCPNILGF